MKLAQNRADTEATERRNIFRYDIARDRGKGLSQFQLPGYRTEHVIAGSGASNRTVGIKPKLAPTYPTNKQTKTRRDDLGHRERGEGSIDCD